MIAKSGNDMLTSRYNVSIDFGVIDHGTKAIKIFEIDGRPEGEDGIRGASGRG